MNYQYSVKHLDKVVSTIYLSTNPSFTNLVKEVVRFKEVMDEILTAPDEEGLFAETKKFYLTQNKDIIKASPKGKYKKYHDQTPQDVINGFIVNSKSQFNITLKQSMSIEYITLGVKLFLESEGISHLELEHVPLITFEEL